ncbi:MAG: thioredoxin-disulfide reductase [Myxococcales bacterium]|nr:thioredoxin-disulfide reductase [Myxococcales bacterium]
MMSDTIEKLVIIGSGPAGYTAALYAARAELAPLVFEGSGFTEQNQGNIAGGQLMTTTDVENFPGFPDGILGPELMNLFKRQAERFGAKCVMEDVIAVDLASRPFTVTSETQTVKAHAIIISTGATAKRLHVKGEDRLWMKGISACAVCDGALPIFREKPLAVIGGGDSACEEATFLTKYASRVYMLVRRDEMRASKIMAKRVEENPKIEILWNTVAEEALGETVLEVLRVVNKTSGETRDLKVSGLFYAIGHKPNTDLFVDQLKMNEVGYLVTKPDTTYTDVEGVFACGDVKDPVYRQAVTAAGSGCQAALDAERWLGANGIE